MSKLPIINSSNIPGWLTDQHGRRLKYVRISVTDRCDLRCQYCMPPEGIPASAKQELLTFEEIVRTARIFTKFGVKTVRITGGEPLIRKNLVHLIRQLRDDVGIEDIAMTSNASILAKHAKSLADAGLKRINISLDSLDHDTFRSLTRGGELGRVLEGVQAALDNGLAVKTNTVVIRHKNNLGLQQIVEWAWSKNITPRFIELMPLGEGAKLGKNAVVPVREMRQQLKNILQIDEDPEIPLDRGPASYYRSQTQPNNKAGFIGAVTDNFCDRCNRVRLTAKGDIKACLASPDGFSVRDALRQDNDDNRVLDKLSNALFGKRPGHEFHVIGAHRHTSVNMSSIGG